MFGVIGFHKYIQNTDYTEVYGWNLFLWQYAERDLSEEIMENKKT
jgi:hypothetical protein